MAFACEKRFTKAGGGSSRPSVGRWPSPRSPGFRPLCERSLRLLLSRCRKGLVRAKPQRSTHEALARRPQGWCSCHHAAVLPSRTPQSPPVPSSCPVPKPLDLASRGRQGVALLSDRLLSPQTPTPAARGPPPPTPARCLPSAPSCCRSRPGPAYDRRTLRQRRPRHSHTELAALETASAK